MFQFRQFIKKECIIIMQQKKLILAFTVLCFYPLIQLIANNPLLPINYIMPCLISFVILLPTDITRIIYNMELTSKTDEILKISNINNHIIIASKLTVPLLLSLCMLVITLIINHVLPNFTQKEIADGFVNTYYIVYCVLLMITSNLFCILVSLRKAKYRDSKESTEQAFYMFIICFILYAIRFIMGYWLIYIVLFAAILLLYVKIFIIYSDTRAINFIKKSSEGITNKATFGILSCFLNNFFMNTRLLILIIIFFNFSLSIINRYYLKSEVNNLSISLISLLVSIAIGNKLIFLGVIHTKKYKIYTIIKNSPLSINEFIWIHIRQSVLICVLFNLLLSLALGMSDFNSLLSIVLIILEVNLFTLLSSFLVKSIKFHTYYALLNSVILFLVLSTLILLNIPHFILIIFILLTFSAIQILYEKYYHHYFE